MLPAGFEKPNSFLRPLKKNGFKEERVTTIGWYDIGKSHDPGIQQEPPRNSSRLTGCKFSVAQMLRSSAQREGDGIRRERYAKKNAWDSEPA